jgi:hypothetical protein
MDARTEGGAMSAADEYNIDTYYREINFETRDRFMADPPVRVGQPAPNFELPRVGGGSLGLTELLQRGHVALIFGCFTAPPAMAQLPALEAHHRTYGGRGISLVFVYTREIHPGEYFSPHRSIEQKLDQAKRMADHGRITFPVVADDLEGTTHNAYGGLPSMACVIQRDGTLVYRGSWTEADMLQVVFENLLLRDQTDGKSGRNRVAYHEWLSFMPSENNDSWALLDLAGPKARADYERANAPR